MTEQLYRIPASILRRKGGPIGIYVLAVFNVLALHERDGYCWPSKALIARTLGITRPTVQKCIETLVGFGVIRVVGKCGGSDKYQLLSGIYAGNRQPDLQGSVNGVDTNQT